MCTSDGSPDAAALAWVLGATMAHAEGDAAKGEKVFAKCKTCHEIATVKNKVGPTLHGVIGRKAGTVEDSSIRRRCSIPA